MISSSSAMGLVSSTVINNLSKTQSMMLSHHMEKNKRAKKVMGAGNETTHIRKEASRGGAISSPIFFLSFLSTSSAKGPHSHKTACLKE